MGSIVYTRLALGCVSFHNRGQELVLSENKLLKIPGTLAELKALRVFCLQNKIKTLPHALGLVITLEELHCAGNVDLDIVPKVCHSDAATILWVCRLHQRVSRTHYIPLVYAHASGISRPYLI